jgi:hypothetical protein
VLSRRKAFYSTSDVAQALDSPEDPWDSQRARRWLKATKAGIQRGRGRGHWITTRERLRDAFPEAWIEIAAKFDRDV